MLFRIFSILFLATAALNAQEEKKSEQDIAKISEAFGHLIGKNIDTIGVNFDLECVIKGLQDSMKGKESPLSEVECVQAISIAQEESYKKQAQENLASAEKFLKTKAKEKGIVSLEEGKLQYKIERKGEGKQVLASSNPIIKYVGKYQDGTVFGASTSEESISLEETIPGFTKGLVGMKEGEKRTLYIHPELGYGTSGYLPPNSLLTFEIEVIKADTPLDEETHAAQSSDEKPGAIELPASESLR